MRVLLLMACATSVFWIGMFAFGGLSLRAGWSRIADGAAGPISVATAAQNEAAPTPLAVGTSIDTDAHSALKRFGNFRTLIVLHAPDSELLPPDERYPRVLMQRYESLGLRIVQSRHLTDSIQRALSLTTAGAQTLLIAGDGVLRFQSPGLLPNDELRQLIERTLLGTAETAFADPPVYPLEWNRRLAEAEIWARDDSTQRLGFVSLAEQVEELVVLDASCSACVIEEQLRRVRLADSLARARGNRLGLLVPDSYDAGLPQLGIRALSMPVFFARGIVSPELAYITRNIPEADPVVLTLDTGGVRTVRRLRNAR